MLSPFQYRCRPKIASTAVIVSRGPIVFPIVRTSPIPNLPIEPSMPWHGPLLTTNRFRRHYLERSILWRQLVRLPLHGDSSTTIWFELIYFEFFKSTYTILICYLECTFLDWWACCTIVCSGRIGEIEATATSERVNCIIEIGISIDIRCFSVCTKSIQWWPHLS